MSSNRSGSTRVIHRSSVTGRIVTGNYAKNHPARREREVVRVPPPKSDKR